MNIFLKDLSFQNDASSKVPTSYLILSMYEDMFPLY